MQSRTAVTMSCATSSPPATWRAARRISWTSGPGHSLSCTPREQAERYLARLSTQHDDGWRSQRTAFAPPPGNHRAAGRPGGRADTGGCTLNSTAHVKLQRLAKPGNDREMQASKPSSARPSRTGPGRVRRTAGARPVRGRQSRGVLAPPCSGTFACGYSDTHSLAAKHARLHRGLRLPLCRGPRLPMDTLSECGRAKRRRRPIVSVRNWLDQMS